MRLAALAAGLVLAGAASAAEAPTRVDLVVEGQVVSIRNLGHDNWPEDVKARVTMWGSHGGVYSVEVKVEQVRGGVWDRPGIDVVTDYQNWFPTWDSHAVFWLRRDPDGRWRLVCAQAPMTPSIADPRKTRTLSADWRSRPDCSPPADITYEPGS